MYIYIYVYIYIYMFIYICLCIYIYYMSIWTNRPYARLLPRHVSSLAIPGRRIPVNVWNFFNDMCICPFGSSGPSHWSHRNSRESTNQSNEFKWNWTSYHFVITSIIELNGCRWEIQRKMEDPKKRDRLPADLQTAPGPFGVNITLRQHKCEQICF